ncbi:MAG: hypothetical protein ABI767_10740 [Rhodanobacter sp.]
MAEIKEMLLSLDSSRTHHSMGVSIAIFMSWFVIARTFGWSAT